MDKLKIKKQWAALVRINSDSGEEDIMLSATVTLTDAQIKDVGTPFVIIPATEVLGYNGAPTQIPVPLSAVIRLDNSAGEYGNVGVSTFVIALGSDWSLNFLSVQAGNLTGAGAVHTYITSPFDPNTSDNVPVDSDPHVHAITVPFTGIDLTDNIEDNAIAIVLSNSDGDLTGGNAANSLKVTVFYVLMTL